MLNVHYKVELFDVHTNIIVRCRVKFSLASSLVVFRCWILH